MDAREKARPPTRDVLARYGDVARELASGAEFVRDDGDVDVFERGSVVFAEPRGVSTQHFLADTLHGEIVSSLGEAVSR